MSVRVFLPFLLLLAQCRAECQPAGPESPKDADARRQTTQKFLDSSGAVPDTTSILREFSDRVIALQQSLTSQPALADGIRARQELRSILAAPEFAAKMRGPSAWERWKRQIALWLVKRFGGLLNSMKQHPTTSQAIFWTVALASLGVIAFGLFRLFRRVGTVSLEVSGVNPAVLPSQMKWLPEARSAAEHGEFSRAIQCAYWAGVNCLQKAGSLPKSSVLTPREFLGALRTATARESLQSLTLSLERFWYGRNAAAAEDFLDCLRHLEGLGCRLE